MANEGREENLMSFSDDEDIFHSRLEKPKSTDGKSWFDVLSRLEKPVEQANQNGTKETQSFKLDNSSTFNQQQGRNTSDIDNYKLLHNGLGDKTIKSTESCGNTRAANPNGKGRENSNDFSNFGSCPSTMKQCIFPNNSKISNPKDFRTENANYYKNDVIYSQESNYFRDNASDQLKMQFGDEGVGRSEPDYFRPSSEQEKRNFRRKPQTRDKWIDFSSDDEASFNERTEMRPRLRSSLSETDLYSSSPESSLHQSSLWSPTFSSQKYLSDVHGAKTSNHKTTTADVVHRNGSSDSNTTYYSEYDPKTELYKSSLYVDLGQKTTADLSSSGSLNRADSVSSCSSLHPYDSIVLKRRTKITETSLREEKSDSSGRVGKVIGTDFSDGVKEKASELLSTCESNYGAKGNENDVYGENITDYFISQQPFKTSDTMSEPTNVREQKSRTFQNFSYPLQVKIPEFSRADNSAKKWKQRTVPPSRPPPPKSLEHRYTTSFLSLDQVQPGSPLKARDIRGEDQKRIMYFGDGLFDVAKERNEEAIAFAKMVSELRSEFLWQDSSNCGYIVSTAVPYEQHIFDSSTECQIVVWTESRRDAVHFRINIHSLVQECIQLAVAYISEGSTWYAEEFAGAFVMKVCGCSEFLEPHRMLVEYEYVKDCLKFSEDIRLVLVESDRVPRKLSRAAADDQVDAVPHNYKDFFDCPNTTAISRQGLLLLMEALNDEVTRLLEEVTDERNPHFEPSRVIQAVKAMCASLATVETKGINKAVENLRNLQHQSERETTGGSPPQIYICLNIDEVKKALTELTDSAILLIEMYCDAFDTDFTASRVERPGLSGSVEVTAMTDQLRVHIASAHRLPLYWKQDYDYYEVSIGIYYGGKLLCPVELTPLGRVATKFFEHIEWDKWLEFQIQVRQLPCESRLCVTLYGLTSKSKGSGPQVNRTALGWVALQLFNFKGVLASGTHLLGLWPGTKANPVGTCTSNLLHPASVLLQIGFERYLADIVFPEFQHVDSLQMDEDEFPAQLLTAKSGYQNILNKDLFHELKPEEQQLLWEHRHYCQRSPRALPLILASVPSWNYQSLPEVYTLLSTWSPMMPIDAMELLKVI